MKCLIPFDLALLITVYLCAYTGQKQRLVHTIVHLSTIRTHARTHTHTHPMGTVQHKSIDIFINFYRISLPNYILITSHREASKWILMSRHRATCTGSGPQGQVHKAMSTGSDAQGHVHKVRCTG